MRVAIITNFYPPIGRGGAGRVAQKMADDFLSKGDEVVVITTANKPHQDYFKNLKIIRFRPINIYFLADASKHALVIRFIWNVIDVFNVFSYWQLKAILKRERPDLAIVHNLKGVGYLTPLLLSTLRLRYIQYVHDIQLSIPSGILLAGEEKSCANNNIFQKIYEISCRRLFSYASEVVSPSQWLMNFYTSKGFFKKIKKIIKPFIWQDYNLTAINSKLQIFKEKVAMKKIINFLYVGQIEEHKGILWLADGWRQLPKNYRLIIVGGGAQEARLKEIICKDQRIHFYGEQDHKSLASIYDMADILVMPTLCYENRPEVILEAYQHNLPVLASNLGGIPEIIIDGKSGILFTTGDFNFFQDIESMPV